MANHCENVLRVSGLYEVLFAFDKKFRNGKKNEKDNYSFSNLYPSPSLSISDISEWRKKHWSVKGDFYENTFDSDVLLNGETEIYYYFDTPWVAPENLILYTSGEFPELEFMLVSLEVGNKIRSLNVYRKGQIIAEEELSDDDIEYWFIKDKNISA